MPIPSSSSSSKPLPLKPILGDYGIPFFGAIGDRLDYFYNQGKDHFFTTRIKKYQSTVFRTNMPPGPFIAQNSQVILCLVFLFRILFDASKVEKRDVLNGTYLFSLSFTGGHLGCAYLDPSESKHTSVKSFFLSLLASKHDIFVPLFRTCLSDLFLNMEDQMASDGKKVYFNSLSDSMSFKFMFQLLCDKDPSKTRIGSKGPSLGAPHKWLGLQLAPLATLGLPKFIDDHLLHTFPFPFFLVKSAYGKLFHAFYLNSTFVLDKAESFGIKREEACHNLVFLAGFNAYGGMKLLLPTLLKWVSVAREELHRQLTNEIKRVSLDKMMLTKSVVYEVFRIEPMLAFQYAKAKEDIVVLSHDAAFEIRKGEMIFGYQPLYFVGHRFIGEGEKLLKYVYWSNGPKNEDPTAENKQFPGKDLVMLIFRLMLVDFFLRYDTFAAEVETLLLRPLVTLTSLTKATNISFHNQLLCSRNLSFHFISIPATW
ncbi:hypothetical protein K2173_002468 [Erythroxylum novogranatense]|uniref:Cytochrome P450 n=1 Tax=Erythroxylum novogranatense TaxID=1862640 RepID=A0AAV8TA49_9ROSI|nr:hypothetical protein K2173_002468 [Erythroxylum novogranatense]